MIMTATRVDGWIEEGLFRKMRRVMPIPTVDILVVHDGRLLLMLRNNEPGEGLWWVPGSRVRYGETLEQAAVRALEEETGLAAVKIERKGVMTHLWSQVYFVTTFFRADVMDEDVKLDAEHKDFKWVSNVPDDIHHYVRQMIEGAGIFQNG